jgi:hypothetical protein
MTSEREMLDRHLTSLRKKRATYDEGFADIMRHLAPYRMDLNLVRGNRYGGQRRDYHILNNHPIRAHKTLSAALMGSITSPAKRWHRLSVTDPDLAEFKPVKVYLDRCREIIDAAFHQSNLYNELSGGLYPDMSAVGTGILLEEETLPGKPHFLSVPVGDYWLSVDHEGKPNAFFREFPMTTDQIMGKFGATDEGRSKISQQVREAYDHGNHQTEFQIRHAILANKEYIARSMGLDGQKPWKSCWWERAGNNHQLLKREGYWEMPVLAPRWESVGTSAYGFGPGWYALGDCKMLQHDEESLLILKDLQSRPPMAASNGVEQPSLVPGSVTYVPTGEKMYYKPAYEPDPNAIPMLRQDIANTEKRISETMYAHLWELLLRDTRTKTATEVDAVTSQVALLQGPLLENLNNGLLEPLIMRTFYILNRADKLPLPPKELEGQEVRVEFQSIMHTMQQATSLGPIQLLVREIKEIGEMRPDVYDKLNVDAIVDDLQRIVGTAPDNILSKDEVAKVRAAAAKRAEAEQTGEAMVKGARAMKDASQADVGNIREIAQAVSPAASAQGMAL